MEKDERETTRVCNHDRCGQFCPVCGEDLTAVEPWRRDLLAHLAAVRKSNRER
jgi:4-alpha-glucanotransferase